MRKTNLTDPRVPCCFSSARLTTPKVSDFSSRKSCNTLSDECLRKSWLRRKNNNYTARNIIIKYYYYVSTYYYIIYDYIIINSILCTLTITLSSKNR